MPAADSDIGAGTMRERAEESRWKLWLLLGADRRVVAALALLSVFVALVGLSQVVGTDLRAAMGSSDPVETLFQGLLTAIITGVTLVVTLSQLVLSQELGALGDQQERMDGAMSFRRSVESVVDSDVTPPDPASFLRSLVAAVGRQAATLQTAADESGDEQLRSFADDLLADADAVGDDLDGSQFGTFEVVFAALNFNYASKIYEARRLRAADATGDDAGETLDDLVETLSLFGPAREHIKTLYFQWELIELSRAIAYAAVPALIVSAGMILYGGQTAVVQGSVLGVDSVVWLVSAATTVALVPFVVLLAYVLRIVTVAKRTLSIGPLVLRDTVHSGGDESEDA
ncbi:MULTISPECIES: hypothetical protein [Halomicrobium]|uniref:Uncharacterized protein n=2 Tax=Halomicrobium mukohataei TaxID=57705 RepID=C7P339_HALMD|nr:MULTISPECIES: hypothetical protein [Halomicrobium]ACV47511.1 conserved hypothetical protein [Halomicrobium mukohataei DSM 12286]QCD65975.1 hypothetical protein E5139_10110 [Halomicrobium mukohataei]QFR20780.1 hypothetical protein GBQ70_10105 [Halomicrobium sp. ZPS1]